MPAPSGLIKCPQCEVPMQQVAARAEPGSLIQLDQCRRCGGIWCDQWELFPIDPDEAERIDVLDESLLTALVERPRTPLYCPRCTAVLQACHDPALPSDLQLERCMRCDGIWLNRGKMKRYKRHQRKVQLEKRGAEAIVRKIPELYDNPKAWVVKGTRGMMTYPRMVDDSENASLSLGRAGRLVLQTLVRMAVGI